MNLLQTVRRTTLVFAAAATLTVGASGAVFAADTATQEITPLVDGELAASIDDFVFEDLEFSFADQTNDGALRLHVVDSRGLGYGWEVSVSSGDFTVGTSPIVIPASGFFIDEADDPQHVAGQPVVAAGPRVPAANSDGALSTARNPIEAAPHSGNGEYYQDLDVSLVVPGGTESGVYQANLTVTIASAL
jgi:hypothetical protein